MVMQDKIKPFMQGKQHLMWTGYAVHHCAMHNEHSPDAPIGVCLRQKRCVGEASKLNHACFSCAEGAGCSATRAATGGRTVCTPPPLRLGSPSRQDAQSIISSVCVLQSLSIFALTGACSR